MKLLSLLTVEKYQQLAVNAEDRKEKMKQITSKVDLTKGSTFTKSKKLYETAFKSHDQKSIMPGGCIFEYNK